ncbi:unnamed protein product [Urochloa decumbens]|uniref:Cystatin domain-containing protein n=1 Tax=Urochloa decumbens TaxID=240449 RepID=A0ABC9H140_9POAL
MATRRTTSLLVLVAAVAISLSVAPPATALDGGWLPIVDINDPHIQELGGWAVSEHNRREHAALKFNRVVSGQYQIVSGVKYNLIVQASNPDGKYSASLTEQEWTNTRILFSFNPVG